MNLNPEIVQKVRELTNSERLPEGWEKQHIMGSTGIIIQDTNDRHILAHHPSGRISLTRIVTSERRRPAAQIIFDSEGNVVPPTLKIKTEDQERLDRILDSFSAVQKIFKILNRARSLE